MPLTLPAIDFGPTAPAALAALQLQRMRATLERAYEKIPFYRKSFDAVGVAPCDLVSLADLARFPFTVKADLRDNYPFGLLADVLPDEDNPARQRVRTMLIFGMINWTHTWFNPEGPVGPEELAEMAIEVALAGR